MTEFEAAAHQLLGVISEALHPAIGYDDESTIRLSIVETMVLSLVNELVIDQKFPMLPDQPAKDMRRTADRIRERIRVRLAGVAA